MPLCKVSEPPFIQIGPFLGSMVPILHVFDHVLPWIWVNDMVQNENHQEPDTGSGGEPFHMGR